MSDKDVTTLEASDATLMHLALLNLGTTVAPVSDAPPGRDNAIAHLRSCGKCQSDLIRLIETLADVRKALGHTRCQERPV